MHCPTASARRNPGPLNCGPCGQVWFGSGGLGGGIEGGGLGVQGGGEAAQRAAAVGSVVLAFEPRHGGQANSGLAGELFLGQAVLAASLP